LTLPAKAELAKSKEKMKTEDLSWKLRMRMRFASQQTRTADLEKNGSVSYSAILRSGEIGQKSAQIGILPDAGCAAKGGISVTGND
jgi:hypothetical protein